MISQTRKQYPCLIVHVQAKKDQALGCADYANPLAHKPAPLLHEEATVIPLIAPVTGVATHPEDDRILAIAVSGKAAFLVTGDTQLQKLGSFKGVTILSPADFLKTLYEQELGKGEAA